MSRFSKNNFDHTPLYFWVGTIAELIKLVPVFRVCEANDLPYTLVATGQNNLLLSDTLTFIHKKKPDLVISEAQPRQTPLGLLVWSFKTVLSGWLKMSQQPNLKNSYLVVHGDTVSTVIGAVVGKVMRMKVVHLEAGLRSFDIQNPFPEEINRSIVSDLADIHFAPNDWAIHNLVHKGGQKVSTEQNTLVESVELALSKQPTSAIVTKQKQSYFVFVLHRQENVYNQELLTKLVQEVTEFDSMKCVFILHHITKTQLQKFNLLSSLQEKKNIEIVDRLPFIDMIHLLRNAQFLISDGGSNQEESSYLGLPCLILRKKTERIEGLNHNVVLLGEQPLSVIHDFFLSYSRLKFKPLNVKKKPSDIIIRTLYPS